MPDHYYSQQPASASDVHAFAVDYAGQALQFETDAGVFSKTHLDKGTSLLLHALPDGAPRRALDVGCGWGAMGVCMAARWPTAQVVMTDINERAVSLAQQNLARNGLSGTVLQGDGLAHIKGPFDLIVTNPPIRAGKAVIYRLFAQSAALLDEDGALYVVIRKQQGADSAAKYLQTLLPKVETIARGSGFRVLRASRAW